LSDAPGGGLKGNPHKFTAKQLVLIGKQAAVLKSIPGRRDQEKQVTVDLIPPLDKIDAL